MSIGKIMKYYQKGYKWNIAEALFIASYRQILFPDLLSALKFIVSCIYLKNSN